MMTGRDRFLATRRTPEGLDYAVDVTADALREAEDSEAAPPSGHGGIPERQSSLTAQ
jgi:hypothetical protein